MTYQRRINPVHRSLSRPLTILGAERKLFFFAMCLGAATFNLLGSFLGGVLMFLLLYFVARWATATDPQILQLLFACGETARAIRPGRNSRPSRCEDGPCLISNAFSRTTKRPARSTPWSISLDLSTTTSFSPRSGDLGVVLEVRGVDYECLEARLVDALDQTAGIRAAALR